MEGSDVLGAVDGIVGVKRGVAETTSSRGTGGAEVGDVGVGGIVFVGSSPCSIGTGVDYACSVCGGSGGATMGWAPRGTKLPAN